MVTRHDTALLTKEKNSYLQRILNLSVFVWPMKQKYKSTKKTEKQNHHKKLKNFNGNCFFEKSYFGNLYGTNGYL